VPDATHSPTVVDARIDVDPMPAFPAEKIADLVWEASDLVSTYCTLKGRADNAAEYLALESLVVAFEGLFRALDFLDPRFGPDRPAVNELRPVDAYR